MSFASSDSTVVLILVVIKFTVKGCYLELSQVKLLNNRDFSKENQSYILPLEQASDLTNRVCTEKVARLMQLIPL